MNKLVVLWQNQTKVEVNQQAITAHLEDILRRLGLVGMVEIEITVVGDQAIAKLKHQFLGQNEPTDVLSFPNPRTTDSSLIGSIVVSVDTAAKQAKEAKISLIDELKMLTSHGLLHLLEFHHR